MAMTVWKEKNRIHWLGIRPAIIGEQLLAYVNIVTVDTTVYTVPANKTLLLFNDWLMVSGAVAAGSANLIIRNAAAATVYVLGIATNQTNIGNTLPTTRSRFIPIEIQEGFDIRIDVLGGSSVISCGIEGILIDPEANG
jgi:hypothetical protein